MKAETCVVRNNKVSTCQSKKQQETDQEELRRGPWTLEEDTLLIHYVRCHGEGRWNLLAKAAGLKRTGKSCRLRWLNYLKPDIKRGNLTPQEQLLILELHSKWGNRWSKIAAHLPGRTDNEIKNYWRTRVQKQARQLNMESNSQSFIDAIRCFYMPRLVQKIEQSSTSCATLNSEASSPSSPGKFPEFPTGCTKNSTYCSINTLSNMPEIPHQQTSASSPYTRGKTVNVAEDCYNVDSSSYDMELSSMSALTDCHMPGQDWLGDDMAEYGMWDLDELWPFRK